jgi:hypothetical protein
MVVHLIIALALTFSPKNVSLGRSKIGMFYDHLVHLGPFYREESIQSTPHFILKTPHSEQDLIVELTTTYQGAPWKVNRLALRDHIRKSCDGFLNSGLRRQSITYRQLEEITTRFAREPVEPGDSVSWIYYHRWYHANGNTWIDDTMFVYRLKWRSE